MTANRQMIRKLREQVRMHIDEQLETLILERYSAEPEGCSYTEQDLHEQIRHLALQHHADRNTLDRAPRTSELTGGRL